MGITQQFFVFCSGWPWPLTLTFELWRHFCTMCLTAKFDRPMFSGSEVIVRTSKQTNKQTDAMKHRCTSLRYATPVGNENHATETEISLHSCAHVLVNITRRLGEQWHNRCHTSLIRLLRGLRGACIVSRMPRTSLLNSSTRASCDRSRSEVTAERRWGR